jgi:hypothetical protein
MRDFFGVFKDGIKKIIIVNVSVNVYGNKLKIFFEF